MMMIGPRRGTSGVRALQTLALMFVAAGCGSSSSTTGTGGQTGGGTGGAGARGTGGSTGGSPGQATGGSGTGGVRASGGAGGSGAGGHAGAAGGVSGAGGHHDTGRDAGADGAGAEGGKAGGDAAAGADGAAAAKVLDGFALLKPCFSAPGSCAGCTCDENSSALLNTGMAPENQHITKQFGGDPNVTYHVTLRVVGVAERYWYAGGMLDPIGKVFYTGGLPTIHMPPQAPNTNLAPGQGACKIHPPQTDSQYPIPFTVPVEVAPADGCYNGFNVFAMTISSPKQTYFLNYTTDYDNVDRQPHAVYKTDYTVTIPFAGQSQIDFYVIDGDHHEVANTTMTVPNVKTATIKQPYVGNFLELQVVGVTP
jgi:hypothetical protein